MLLSIVDDYSIETMLDIENSLYKKNIFLCGRFANWKYFNMDNCMEQAIKISNIIGK
jgi:UDP-galactopyranose mutase